jgi:hypothetical protein
MCVRSSVFLSLGPRLVYRSTSSLQGRAEFTKYDSWAEPGGDLSSWYIHLIGLMHVSCVKTIVLALILVSQLSKQSESFLERSLFKRHVDAHSFYCKSSFTVCTEVVGDAYPGA